MKPLPVGVGFLERLIVENASLQQQPPMSFMHALGAVELSMRLTHQLERSPPCAPQGAV